MMKNFALLIISVYLILPFFGVYAEQQAHHPLAGLVKNCNFEESYPNYNKPKDWKTLTDIGIEEADSDAVYEWDDKTFYSGNRSVKVRKNNEDKIAGWAQEFFCLQPGKWYEVSAWVKTEDMVAVPFSKSGANLSLIFLIKGVDSFIYEAPFVKGSQGWQQQKLVFVVPEGCSEVRLVLGLQKMEGTVWWDEVSIKEISPVELSGVKEIEEEQMDKYGGWKKVKGKATDFFHTEKINNRWWIITPEGNGFIVVGIQHMLRPDNLSEKWIEGSIQKLKEWGFNSISHNTIFKGFVYTESVSPSFWGFPFINPEERVRNILVPLIGIDSRSIYAAAVAFPDVFDNKFKEIVDEEFRNTAMRLKNDPWLLGYFIGNELPWDGYPPGGITLFDMFFALPKERPGKRVLVQYLKKQYKNNIGNFNQAWGTAINDFEELLTITRIGIGVKNEQCNKDISEFIRFVAETYFKLNYEIIKKYDPNHMILGVRFSEHSRTPKEVLEVIGKYTDIVSFNTYPLTAPLEWLEQSYKFYNKPILITEFSCKAQDSGLPNRVGAGIVFRTQKERALWYERFVLRLMSSPNMVGYIWYKYEDDPARKIGEDGNYGLVTRKEELYKDLVETVKRVNRSIYRLVIKED